MRCPPFRWRVDLQGGRRRAPSFPERCHEKELHLTTPAQKNRTRSLSPRRAQRRAARRRARPTWVPAPTVAECCPTAVGVAWLASARNGAPGAFPGAARRQPALAASQAATARCRRRRHRLYLRGQLHLRTPRTTFHAEVSCLPPPSTRRENLCASRAAPGSGWSRTPATLAAPTKPPSRRTWRS